MPLNPLCFLMIVLALISCNTEESIQLVYCPIASTRPGTLSPIEENLVIEGLKVLHGSKDFVLVQETKTKIYNLNDQAHEDCESFSYGKEWLIEAYEDTILLDDYRIKNLAVNNIEATPWRYNYLALNELDCYLDKTEGYNDIFWKSISQSHDIDMGIVRFTNPGFNADSTIAILEIDCRSEKRYDHVFIVLVHEADEWFISTVTPICIIE